MHALLITILALLICILPGANDAVCEIYAPYDAIYTPTLTISPRRDSMTAEEVRFFFDGDYLTTTYIFKGTGEEVLLQLSMPPVYRADKYIHLTMWKGLAVTLQGENVPLTHESLAYSPKGENVTALLAEAGLTPNERSRAITPKQVQAQKAWKKLHDKGAIAPEDETATKYWEAHWVATNRWWAMVRLPQGKTTLSFRYQMLNIGGNSRFAETLAQFPDKEDAVRFAKIDLHRAFTELKPLKTDTYYGGTWFSIPPAPMPWSFVPKLHFEAIWPVFSQYVQRPMYLAARIGDVEQQGLGRISLTVENYSSIVPGIFCAINFSDKP